MLAPGGGPTSQHAALAAEAVERQAGYATATASAQASLLTAGDLQLHLVAGPWGSPIAPSLFAGANFSRDWELADF